MFRSPGVSSKTVFSGWLTVAALLPSGSVQATSTETLVYSFASGKDGAGPQGTLLRDNAGNLYGTTAEGGRYAAGIIFKITEAGKEKVLYSFTGGDDGGGPYAGLLEHSGKFYGTTVYGGADGFGTVFDIVKHGAEFGLVHSFAGTDGENSVANFVEDKAGNLYGTAWGGGAPNLGTVFEFTSAGTEKLLHVFTGGTDGAGPRGPVIVDKAGNLYGTTEQGGANNTGTIFKIAPDGTESVLYTFTDGNDGGNPFAGLIEFKGKFYGTTSDGGTNHVGTVFEFTPSGVETVLHSFNNDGSDGFTPAAGLIKDGFGNFYGTTSGGGAYGGGTVFKITPAGIETVLYSFAGGSDGAGPQTGLIMDGAGNLYGTTTVGGHGYGTVFKIQP